MSPPPGFQYPGQSPYAAGPSYATTPRPTGNGFAIASLVLGIIWVCGLGSLLAIIFGVIALRQAKRGPISGAAKGMAAAGIVLGSFGVVGTVAAIAVIATQADDVVRTSDDEKNDVDILSCRAGAEGTVVVLEVTNDSSRTSNYIISIDVEARGSGDGSDIVPTTVNQVAPDDTVEVTLQGTEKLSEPACSIGYVQRFAAD
jgi:hypothetical protein